jgi:hypothetical protein
MYAEDHVVLELLRNDATTKAESFLSKIEDIDCSGGIPNNEEICFRYN